MCFICNPWVYLFSSRRTIVKICRMYGGLEVLFKDVFKLGFYWVSFFKKCSIGKFQGHISRRFLLGKNCMQYNMLTIIKAFSVLLNNKTSHFKKGCETDACKLVHLFWLATDIIWPIIYYCHMLSIHAFSSSSEFKTLLLNQYFYYDGVCTLPIHSVLWSLIGPITIFKNFETLFQCVTQSIS